MKKEELVEGVIYLVKHSSGLLPARLDMIRKIEGYRQRMRRHSLARASMEYRCTNLKTGRVIVFRSPVKFVEKQVAH